MNATAFSGYKLQIPGLINNPIQFIGVFRHQKFKISSVIFRLSHLFYN